MKLPKKIMTEEIEQLRVEVERLKQSAGLPDELAMRIGGRCDFGDLTELTALLNEVLAWHEQRTGRSLDGYREALLKEQSDE